MDCGHRESRRSKKSKEPERMGEKRQIQKNRGEEGRNEKVDIAYKIELWHLQIVRERQGRVGERLEKREVRNPRIERESLDLEREMGW